MEGRTGSHVACDMLRTSEGRIADGAFVITGHWEEGREERAREKERKKEEMAVANPVSLLFPRRRRSGAMRCLALLIMTSLLYIKKKPRHVPPWHRSSR